MEDFDGPYFIEHGDLWLRPSGPAVKGPLAPGPTHVCDGTGEIGIAFDSEDGTLHRRGEASKVHEWADKTRRKFAENGFDDMARAITVISFPVTPETVAELNACAEITGRVLKLADNLSKLLETHPELLTMPRYPAN